MHTVLLILCKADSVEWVRKWKHREANPSPSFADAKLCNIKQVTLIYRASTHEVMTLD